MTHTHILYPYHPKISIVLDNLIDSVYVIVSMKFLIIAEFVTFSVLFHIDPLVCMFV